MELLPEPVAKELLAPDPLADDLIIGWLPDRSEDELAIRRLSARPVGAEAREEPAARASANA